MANLFLETPIYLDRTTLTDTTTKTDLKALTNDEKDVLIVKAQKIIDRYIWSYWTPAVEGQAYIFPILIDEVSTIPKDIKEATFYICEQVFENGDNIVSVTGWEVVQESTGDRSIRYSEWTSDTAWIVWIPKQALVILNKYKQIFFKNKI